MSTVPETRKAGPVPEGGAAPAMTPAEIARMRVAAIGKYKNDFEGFDVSLQALKTSRGDPEERFKRKFGPDL